MRSRRDDRPIGQIKCLRVVFETKQKPFLFECRLGFRERQVVIFECRLGFQERQLFISRMQVEFSRETGFSLGMQLFISRMQVGFSRETGFSSSNAGSIFKRDRF